MTTLAAYTGPSPATGYVGYINVSQRGDEVIITVRPESADCSGTASVIIPTEAARALFDEVCAALTTERDALAARVAELEGALRNIQYEAERENGGWIHLKRCIAVQARQALGAKP